MNGHGGRGDKDTAVTSKSAAAESFGRFDEPQEEQK